MAGRASPKPKRRWHQRLIRGACLLICLLVLGYATLPWWLPRAWLRDRLAQSLSAQLGVAVAIDAVDLSWGDGLRIDGLDVANPDGFGPGPMLSVRSIRMSLEPLQLLLRRRTDWMVVDQPRLDLAIDAAHRLNVSAVDLAPLMEVTTERTSIRRAEVTLTLPDDPQRLRLHVADAQLQFGRLRQFGRLTLSASLDQPQGRSPVGLTVLTGQAAGDAKAVLQFVVTDLDLGALSLIDRLGLPLRRLDGRLDAEVRCWLDERGMVRDLGLKLQPRQLDMQPIQGPPMPLVAEAGLELEAALDVVAQVADVHRLRVRLPGLELAGHGRLHISMLDGQWQGARRLHLDGQVDPATLTRLIRGRASPLPGGVTVHGPVSVTMDYAAVDRAMQLAVTLDASAALWRRQGRTIKSAAVPARCSLDLTCRPLQRWNLTGQVGLQLGGNDMTVAMDLLDVDRLAGLMLEQPRQAAQAFLAELARRDCHGGLRLADPAALTALHPGAEPLLAAVELDGELAGQFRLSRTDQAELDVTLTCPAGSVLRVGDWLNKPADRALGLRLRTLLAEEPGATSHPRLECRSGRGLLIADLSNLTVAEPGGEGIHLAGTMRVDAVEELLSLLPALPEGAALAGDAVGAFDVQMTDQAGRIWLESELTALAVDAGGVLSKQRGQPGALRANVLVQPGERSAAIDIQADLPGGAVGGRIRLDDAGWDARLSLQAADAAWLSQQSPLLAEAMPGLRVAGALQGECTLHAEDQTLRLHAAMIADEAELQAPDHRRKPRGAPLRIRADAALGRAGADGARQLTVHDLAVDAAGVSARVSGAVELSAEGSLTAAELAGQISAEVDDATLTLLPELRPWVERNGLGGGVRGWARVQIDPQQLRWRSRVDLTDLVARGALALPAGGAVEWVKPAGAEGVLEIECTARDGRWWLNNLHVQTDAIDLLAGAAGGGGEGDLHVRLAVADCSSLPAWAPALAPHRPSGGLRIEGELAWEDSQPRLKYATIDLDRLAWQVRGRAIEADGAIALEAVPLGAVDDWLARPIGRLHVDGLALRVDQTHLSLRGQLADWPDRPTGQLTALADHADLRDLAGWLTDRPVEQVTDPEPLSEARRQELAQQGRAAVDRLRALLAEAELELLVRVDRLDNWPDQKVGIRYDVQGLRLTARAVAGSARLEYVGGLNGGTLAERYETDLTDPRPTVLQTTRAEQLLAGENLQPQVEAQFPGNEVRGWMSRSAEVQIPLADMIAAGLDPRFPAIAVGTGRTEFVDGVTRGRAAPMFMTRIFPGLNLVEYPYRRMIGFAEFRPDGSVYNDMIFTGRDYDMYIEGLTDADRVGQYTIGVILLGQPQSAEWNHANRLGRVPVLKWQARIVNGERVDEQVSYPLPNETAWAIFLENNPVLRPVIQSLKGTQP